MLSLSELHSGYNLFACESGVGTSPWTLKGNLEEGDWRLRSPTWPLRRVGPSQFKIEPLKMKIVEDPNYAENTWAVLDSALDEIWRKNSSRLSYEELYRSAYNMCLHRQVKS